MTDTSLARIPQTPRNLATVRPAPIATEGMEGMTARDLALPRWSITQGMTKRVGSGKHGGEFWNNVLEEYREALEVVVLAINPQRIMWKPDLDDHTPLCTSTDLVNGSTERDDQGRFGTCADCALNTAFDSTLWDKDPETGKPKRPRCNYGYRMLTVDPETEDVALMSAMGLSVKAMSGWSSKVKLRGGPFKALTRFTTTEKDKAYVLVPSVKEWLSKTDADMYREMYLNTRGLKFTDVTEDPEGEDEIAEINEVEGSWRDPMDEPTQPQYVASPPPELPIVPKAPPLRTDAEPELSEANWYRNALDLFNACTAAGIKIAANTRPRSDYGIPWFRDFVDYWTDELREHNSRVHAARK